MATVFGIVKQHEGWIEVESQTGVGTRFTVYLPSLPRAAAAAAQLSAAPEVRGGTETILLVEDDVMVREISLMFLQKCGYRGHEATSGVSALTVWEKLAPEIDLLLTDRVMPDGLTGRELAEKLLADKPALKVIYVSGYSADVLQGKMNLREGVNFLQKPFHQANVAKAVRECLDGK